MKNIVFLITGIVALVILTWYAMNLAENDGKSDAELIEFKIENIETIDKIIITDAFGNEFTIKKQNDEWTDKDGGCITQESVGFILDAFRKIEFKGYLPDSSHDKYTNLMASQHTKVEIYQDGAWTKTWYIGPPAKDHYGQVMLLDSDKFGRSDLPVLMKIKGVNGIIEPRFFADPKKWMCTNIFKIPMNEIQKVDVKFNEEVERSFTVTKKGSQMNVYQQGQKLSNVDTAMIFRYLHNYQKIHFEKPNYVLNDKQVDSVKTSTPFSVLTVEKTNGESIKLNCYRIKYKELREEGLAGESINMVEFLNNDRDRFWCELPNGELVKCQYFVFNPLFLGHIYFPMDVSMLKTADGIPEN